MVTAKGDVAGWESPGDAGLECCCNTESLFPGYQRHPCAGRVTGQGGFAGIVQGTRALAEVSQNPLCSLTIPLGEKSLIVSNYLKITPKWSPSQWGRRGRKKAQMYSGRK